MQQLPQEIICQEITKYISNHYIKCLAGSNTYFFKLLTPQIQQKYIDNNCYTWLEKLNKIHPVAVPKILFRDINIRYHYGLDEDIWVSREKFYIDNYHNKGMDIEVYSKHSYKCIDCDRIISFSKRKQHISGMKHILKSKHRFINETGILIDRLDHELNGFIIKDGIMSYVP